MAPKASGKATRGSSSKDPASPASGVKKLFLKTSPSKSPIAKKSGVSKFWKHKCVTMKDPTEPGGVKKGTPTGNWLALYLPAPKSAANNARAKTAMVPVAGRETPRWQPDLGGFLIHIKSPTHAAAMHRTFKATFPDCEPAEFDMASIDWTKALPMLSLSVVLKLELDGRGVCSAIVATGDLWIATPILKDQGYAWSKELESLVHIFGDGTATGDMAPETDTSELEEIYGYEITTEVFDELGGPDDAEVE